MARSVALSIYAVLVALSSLDSFQLFNSVQSRRGIALRMAEDFDYDLIIVGCGVGGHGAALHAR